jgi:hypothetical protein
MSKNIFRQKRTSNFTVVPNEFLHSKTLSFKSKGILTYLLSLPSDWELHVSHLSTISSDGRDSVYNGIQELIEAKYIWRRPRSGTEPGGWEYFIYDSPQLDCPFTGKPHTENPYTENPESGKPVTIKYVNREERTKEEQTTDSEFETFYSLYPRKVSKTNAEKAWKKQKCVLSEIMPALQKQMKLWTDPQFIPHPASWLNGRRWEDELPSGNKATSTQANVRAVTPSGNIDPSTKKKQWYTLCEERGEKQAFKEWLLETRPEEWSDFLPSMDVRWWVEFCNRPVEF